MKRSKGDLVFDAINYSCIIIILLLYLYPLIYFVSASISEPNAVWRGEMWLLPKGVTFEGYKTILKDQSIWTGYRNTIFYTLSGTAINLVMTVLAAYPMSRQDFYFRNHMTVLLTVTMFVSGGMIPSYLLIKNLNMLNTVWALIIPGAVGVWNAIIMRTYFQSNIPNELREAAAIDGCGNTKYLLQVVLPLSAPILAVMTLFYGVGHWNAFFNAMIYMTDRDKFPLQLVLREILVSNQMDELSLAMSDSLDAVKTASRQREIAESIKYGVIIVSTLPVMLVYPFVQRFFVKGIMVGSIKG